MDLINGAYPRSCGLKCRTGERTGGPIIWNAIEQTITYSDHRLGVERVSNADARARFDLDAANRSAAQVALSVAGEYIAAVKVPRLLPREGVGDLVGDGISNIRIDGRHLVIALGRRRLLFQAEADVNRQIARPLDVVLDELPEVVVCI